MWSFSILNNSCWYSVIGQFWQFMSTLKSIAWLRARRVIQTWWACESLPHRTFWHFDIWHFCTRNRLVDWGIWKDAYRNSPSLFAPFFARFFAASPLFSLAWTDREPGADFYGYAPWQPDRMLPMPRDWCSVSWYSCSFTQSCHWLNSF